MDELRQMEFISQLSTQITNVTTQLSAVNTQLVALSTSIQELKADIKERENLANQHEVRISLLENQNLSGRITEIEKYQLKAIGAISVILILANAAISIIIKMFF